MTSTSLSTAGRWPFGRTRRSPLGFTLIELLVVVAIIALLISILLPSLRCAREQARATTCGSNMRGFGNGLYLYTSENNDFIPGDSTSGVATRAKITEFSRGDASVVNDGSLPVQSFDWMTPLVGFDMELPAERWKRWRLLWQRYKCPSVSLSNDFVYTDGRVADLDDFEQHVQEFPAMSYGMSAYFSYAGHRQSGRVLAQATRRSVYARALPDDFNMVVQSYAGRLNEVGLASNKVFIADGTRYISSSGIVNFDASIEPDYFGAFTLNPPTWAGSRAYGPRNGSERWGGGALPIGSPADGKNLAISYRHGCGGRAATTMQQNSGTINALFFDGSVDRLTDRESRETFRWYPSGTLMANNPNEMTVPVEQGYIVP